MPREIRLYQNEREIRARSGTGGGHGLLKNEEKRKRSRKERIRAGGEQVRKSNRVSPSSASVCICGGVCFFFSLSHACKTRGNETAAWCVFAAHTTCNAKHCALWSQEAKLTYGLIKRALECTNCSLEMFQYFSLDKIQIYKSR